MLAVCEAATRSQCFSVAVKCVDDGGPNQDGDNKQKKKNLPVWLKGVLGATYGAVRYKD